jgi:putative transcriptional regulator
MRVFVTLGAVAILSATVVAAPFGVATPFGGQRPGRAVPVTVGQLLVASRGLADPNFAETVVLLFAHDATGAAGLIVNVKTNAALASLFTHLNLPPEPAATAYFGGPVAKDTALALARSTASIGGARLIARDVYLVPDKDAIEKRLAARADASEFRVYLGYAGWSAGQLEREMALQAWHVLDATPDIVFDDEPNTAWRRQIRRTGLLQALSRAKGRGQGAKEGFALCPLPCTIRRRS